MVFTTRRSTGARLGRGTIGRAVSGDLTNWSLLPNNYDGEEFGQLEVLQIFQLAGRWYCLFSTIGATTNPEYLRDRGVPPLSGTHYLVGDTPFGPWRLIEDQFLVGNEAWSMYAGRVVIQPDGVPVFLGFVNLDGDGNFVGGLSNPIPVAVLEDGRLRVDASHYGVTLTP